MPKDKPLALDNQLCFALYSASLAMTQTYKPHLDKLGLTYSQYTIMLILWEKDGVSLKFIADKLGQKSGSLTPVIKRMEKDGWINRVRGIEDDRTLSIQLTKKGMELQSEAKHIRQCIADTCALPEAELNDLMEQLKHLRKQIAA